MQMLALLAVMEADRLRICFILKVMHDYPAKDQMCRFVAR
jgi:hypothetical protein